MENRTRKCLGHCRTLNWLDLPRDVTVSILRRLDQAEILRSVQFVCSTWLHICRDPQMWPSVKLRAPLDGRSYNCLWNRPVDDAVRFLYVNLCFQAFRHSPAHLSEITIESFATDSLLLHISERFTRLKCLRLRHCYSVSLEALVNAFAKLSCLEEVELLWGGFYRKVLKTIGRSCPRLRTLKSNCQQISICAEMLPRPQSRFNLYPISIAKHLPRLRHLELISNALDDDGLRAILDGCPHLESLDLLFCVRLDLSGDLRERCFQQIKCLRLPLDGALDEVNRFYRPYVSGCFASVVHTLQERKPSLLSSSLSWRVVFLCVGVCMKSNKPIELVRFDFIGSESSRIVEPY